MNKKSSSSKPASRSSISSLSLTLGGGFGAAELFAVLRGGFWERIEPLGESFTSILGGAGELSCLRMTFEGVGAADDWALDDEAGSCKRPTEDAPAELLGCTAGLRKPTGSARE